MFIVRPKLYFTQMCKNPAFFSKLHKSKSFIILSPGRYIVLTLFSVEISPFSVFLEVGHFFTETQIWFSSGSGMTPLPRSLMPQGRHEQELNVCVCVWMCVCEREREKEREKIVRVCEYVCLCECVYTICGRKREKMCACECVRQTERGNIYVCAYECVCKSERVRERKHECVCVFEGEREMYVCM